MPDSEPAPEIPADRQPPDGCEEDDAGAGFGTQVLLCAAITGFATCVTMLGPLLVDLSRDLEVSLGQAGLLAAARTIVHPRRSARQQGCSAPHVDRAHGFVYTRR